jgi:hypothetical protein
MRKNEFVKSILFFALAFVLIVMLIPEVYADDEIIITVDGERMNFPGGQAPVIIDDIVFMPVRDVFEHLGFDVKWNSNARQTTVTLSGDNDDFIIAIDSATFIAFGMELTLAAPTQLIGGRTMLPVCAALVSFWPGLNWDKANATVRILTFDYRSEYVQINVTDYPAFVTFFDEINEELHSETIEAVKNAETNDLIMFHFGLGTWIRNHWLWNQRSEDCELVETIIRFHPLLHHPDDMSGFLITAYHFYLNNLEFTMEMYLDRNY